MIWQQINRRPVTWKRLLRAYMLTATLALWTLVAIPGTFQWWVVDAAWNGFVYPLKEVTTVECRTQSRQEADAGCKIPLPIIQWAQFDAYRNDAVTTSIYTTLRRGSYHDGRDMNWGAHPGIDIATAKGTPVYSAGDGIVIEAQRRNAYGNVIKIKHTWSNETIYTVYAHLDSIQVTPGQKVQAGEMIGTVGNSGRTFWALGGYHLDFTIHKEMANRPSYFFYNCKDLSKGEVEIIDKWYCRDEVAKYTIDPIKFLETNKGNIAYQAPNDVQSQVVVIGGSNSTGTLNNVPANADVKTITAQQGSNQFTLQMQWEGIKIKKGSSQTLLIRVTNTDGRSFKGILRDPMTIITSSTSVSSNVGTAQLVADWTIPVTLTAQKSGSSKILLLINQQKIASIPVIVD